MFGDTENIVHFSRAQRQTPTQDPRRGLRYLRDCVCVCVPSPPISLCASIIWDFSRMVQITG